MCNLMPQVKKKSKKEWILNPRNKTAVCILHEYLQRGMSKPPKYETSTEDSSSTPYGCTVVINDIAYGKGMWAGTVLCDKILRTLRTQTLWGDFLAFPCPI